MERPPSTHSERRALLSYLEWLDAADTCDAQPKASDPPLRRWGKRLVPKSLRFRVRTASTRLVSPLQRRRARSLPRPVRLHLGSSAELKEGWINVDLLGDPVDLAWNLTTPLPFEDGSAAAVFSEHLLEHLTLRQGMALAEESFRLLRPGGVLRIGVPDAHAYARSYFDSSDEFLERMCPGAPTRLLAMQYVYYYEGHRTMYDFDTLAVVMRAAGFAAPVQRQFGDSVLPNAPDSEHRRLETLYVEAVK